MNDIFGIRVTEYIAMKWYCSMVLTFQLLEFELQRTNITLTNLVLCRANRSILFTPFADQLADCSHLAVVWKYPHRH